MFQCVILGVELKQWINVGLETETPGGRNWATRCFCFQSYLSHFFPKIGHLKLTNVYFIIQWHIRFV